MIKYYQNNLQFSIKINTIQSLIILRKKPEKKTFLILILKMGKTILTFGL